MEGVCLRVSEKLGSHGCSLLMSMKGTFSRFVMSAKRAVVAFSQVVKREANMSRRHRMSRSGSRSSFTRNALRIHPKNDLGALHVMRGGIRL